jgi:putative NADH-flavin reductase
MSPPSNPTIFLLGATGYVGGCYLNQLLSGPSKPRKITVLCRSKAKFDLIKGLSNSDTAVEPLSGSFEDHDLLSSAVYDHDITIEAGDSDNPELVNSLLRGMEKRKNDGKQTTFIHVSGTGTLADDARGEYKSETVSSAPVQRTELSRN